ncbi:hypothetical protein EVG20_g4190 [Dentipellis fragilis]|uniref:Uncharacterized protein n=1 Tax=Dentipellis fragilis TaxID=205917 RepID=A0A4Y9YYS3_9AGAM|nr:hypothetical protein EVG20_g4190 [Dentipellis fragilis]
MPNPTADAAYAQSSSSQNQARRITSTRSTSSVSPTKRKQLHDKDDSHPQDTAPTSVTDKSHSGMARKAAAWRAKSRDKSQQAQVHESRKVKRRKLAARWPANL